MSVNQFADVDDIESLIYQAIGAGSSCWENLSGAGTFDSTRAHKVGVDCLERLSQLLGENAKLDNNQRDRDFLLWMRDRLVHVYDESSNTDFVLKLEKIAKSIGKQ